MYTWRKLTPEDRATLLAARQATHRPWHSPPHSCSPGTHRFFISAACYEHTPIIARTSERITSFESMLLSVCDAYAHELFAWCVLPNHYHFLIQTDRIKDLLHALGQLHGRTSHAWNGEDACRGRKVWFNAIERTIRSERHFWASLNYTHHNPVNHGYVERWQDWPWSSAEAYLARVGRDEAQRIWRQYPVMDYGKKWDFDNPMSPTKQAEAWTPNKASKIS